MTRAPSQFMKFFLLLGCLAIAMPALAKEKNDGYVNKNGIYKIDKGKTKGNKNGGTYNNGKSNNHATVPEPGTLLLLGSGLIGLAVSAKRMKDE